MTSNRGLYSGLERIYLPIAAAVVVAFLLIVLYAVVRYRRRGDALPGQKDESKAEYVYVGVLVLVAVFLIATTYRYEGRTDASASAHPGLRVRVTAARWRWRFDYLGYGVTVAGGKFPTLVVPTGTQIAFTGTSRDVIHSFWVPAMRFKHDVFPESVAHWHLQLDHPQLAISGECGEYCGLLHADMRFFVNAVPPDEFRRWIAARQRGGA